MNRMPFSILYALLLPLLVAKVTTAAETLPPLDTYGGATTIKTEATGYFRLQQLKGRWFFVTPDGHAFLVNGINHVGGNVMERLYNRDYWQERYRQQTGAAAANPREIFEWKVRRDVQAMGWNAFGSHSHPGFNPRLLPYVKTLRFAEVAFWQEPAAEAFVDVFDPAYEAHCARRAREQALPLKEDPYLIGYTFTDGPVLTEQDAEPHPNKIYVKARVRRLTTWPERLRNLPASAPGKRAYVQTMTGLYGGDIRAFNEIYGATFASFDALAAAVDWRPASDARNARERADNLQFLLRVLERRWQVESAAVRACDPHHLLFGDKLNGNSDTPDEVIQLSGRMFDVVLMQFYGRWPETQALIDRCTRLTGKPFYMGDASCSVPTENMPNPFGVHCRDHAERTQVYRELYYQAFARPDFVGWDWCGWMESWELGGQAGMQHSGIQDPFGNLHPVCAAMSEFARELYRVALPPRAGQGTGEVSGAAAQTPRLKVSENKRFLVTAEGQPFFWLGDTAWELFHRLNREDAEHYLMNRAKLGFNVIQAVALAEFNGLATPNAYGHLPLKNNDPLQPDEDYFKHLDWIVAKANSLGLCVGYLPTWGDKWNKKWGVGPEIFTPQNAEAYGEWLGQRYKDAGMVWILGGDRPVENDTHKQIIRAMARGLRKGDAGERDNNQSETDCPTAPHRFAARVRGDAPAIWSESMRWSPDGTNFA